MTKKRKFTHVLSPYLIQDGMQPLDVLMAATRFYLDKGDVQSAVKVAETAAQYRHPRFQAVAVQGQLFALDETGNLSVSYGKTSQAVPGLRISWSDDHSADDLAAPMALQPAHTGDAAIVDAVPGDARAARISELQRQLHDAEEAFQAQEQAQQQQPPTTKEDQS